MPKPRADLAPNTAASIAPVIAAAKAANVVHRANTSGVAP